MRRSVAHSPFFSSSGVGFRSLSSVPWKLGQENFKTTFTHLQQDLISSKKGKFVHLPQLYDESLLAKGLRPEDCESFLLTEERLSLWDEMNNAKGAYPKRQPLDGTCLSGPNGVGKSSVLHMLASVAHVNNWLVLYIVSYFLLRDTTKNTTFFFVIQPKSGEWTTKLVVDDKPNAGPASIYLLERFIELNEAHKEALDNLKPGLWSRIIAAVNEKMNPFDVQHELLTTLNKQKEYVGPSCIYFIPISNYFFSYYI